MYKKIALIAGFGLLAVGNLLAASVQLGQIIGGVNYGLTTSYMTSGVGSTGSATLNNYDTTLFSNSTNSGTPPTPFTGYSNSVGVASTPGSTAVNASGTTFAMISQSENNGNYWNLIGATPSITIPVGVFAVKNVWTMLQNAYGPNGISDTSLTFTFDNNANGSDAGSLKTVVLNYVNGAEIRDAVDCTDATSFCTSLTFAKTVNAITNGVVNSGSAGAAAYNISASNVFSSVYNGGSGSPYTSTSGNLTLDSQGIGFGNTFVNQYLVSIKVTDLSGVAGVSGTAVSAVSLVTATPEPSSVLLLSGGLGIIGLAIRRRMTSPRS